MSATSRPSSIARRPAPALIGENGGAAADAAGIVLQGGANEAGNKPLGAQWELVPDRFAPPAGIEKLSLEKLAEAINGRLQTIESSIFDARKHAASALQGAIEAGHYLNASQAKCPTGKWGLWREEHCSRLSKATAYRYMSLARKVSHVRRGAKMQTLRQAYLAVGLVAGSTSAEKTAPDLSIAPPKEPTDFVASVRSSREHLEGFRQISLERMEPELLERLSDELSTLDAVCGELKNRIAKARGKLGTGGTTRSAAGAREKQRKRPKQ